MSRANIIHGDVERALRAFPDAHFDAVLCDPPYELSNDGKASPVRVAFEFMFPKKAEVKPGFSERDELSFLIRQILDLGRGGGGIPRPTTTVPVSAVAFDGDAARGNHDVDYVREGAVGTADRHARHDAEPEPSEYIGCFALECTDPSTMLDALNRGGACFFAGRIGIGFGIAASSLPALFRERGAIDGSDEDVRALDDALSVRVGASTRAEANSVPCLFSLAGCDEDRLSAAAALTFIGVAYLGGARLVRASAGARGLSPKLQPRRIRVVGARADRALTFDLLVHPQNVQSAGFMGKAWDGTKVAFDVAMWSEVLRVLKPGGHLIAFSGTRTYHRMVCAIEDAGFEVRDQINWLYGSGFPKSLDVSKALDKAAGVAPLGKEPAAGVGFIRPDGDWNVCNNRLIMPPATTDAAREWQGYGTALKPACEPAVLARKPLGIPEVDVVRNVERGLRHNGVKGEIRWASHEHAGAAVSSSKTPRSFQTAKRPVAETSVVTAEGSETESIAPQIARSIGTDTRSGSTPTLGVPQPIGVRGTEDCANKSSRRTAARVHAAESASATSSRSTMSTEAVPLTEGPSTVRSTRLPDEPDSLPTTESFVGIATGLSGSMGVVRIDRLPNGSFVWPEELPKYVAAQSLTVAENVAKWGVGALAIDACRIEANGEKIAAHHGTGGGAGRTTGAWSDNYKPGDAGTVFNDTGRWPANVILDEDWIAIYTLRDNLPRDVERMIVEFYDGRNPLSDMRDRIARLPVSHEANTVLLPDVLGEASERESEGRRSSDERTEAHGSIPQKDEGESEAPAGTVASGLERRTTCDVTRVHHDRAFNTLAGGAGSFRADGDEGAEQKHPGTPDRDGASIGTGARPCRDRSSSKRGEARQSTGESGTSHGECSHAGALGRHSRDAVSKARERATSRDRFLVLVSDIPKGWLGYFEPTELGIRVGAGAMLDAQTGELRTNAGKVRSHNAGIGYHGGGAGSERTIEASSGGASRFFYCAKASRAERDAGCEDLPARTGGEATDREDDSPGTRSPRAGAGRTGGARNHHPTVKPIALCEYLAKLILPPKPGRILVPFAGSGSEMIGARWAGWPVIVGIEREAEYVEIATRRLRGIAKVRRSRAK